MKCLNRYYKYLDIFGIQYDFLFEGEKKLKTTAGANLSILFVFLILVLFIRSAIDCIQRRFVNIMFDRIVEMYDMKYLSNENLTFAFRIEDFNGNIFENSSIIQNFDLKILSFINKKGNWSSVDEKSIIVKKCDSLSDYKSIQNKYRNLNLSKWYCINFADINYLGGYWDGEFARYLRLDTIQCTNSSSNNYSCAPLEIIKKVLNSNSSRVYFSYLYEQAIPRMANLSFPLITNFVYLYDTLDIRRTKRKYITYKSVYQESDFGWIFESKFNSTIYSIDDQVSDNVFKDEEELIIYRMNIFFGRNKDVYTRTYPKIQEIFGQIGGFSNFFYKLILIVYELISVLIKNRKIMKKIRLGHNQKIVNKLSLLSLKFYDKEKKILDNNKKSLKIGSDETNTQSTDKNISKINLPKILPINKEPGIKTISFIIYLKNLCIKKKLTFSEKELVDDFYNNKKYFENVLDVSNLVKFYKEFQYFKKLILNDYQIIALKLIKDKIKNEEEDNELLLKRLENYFEEAKKNDQIDYIDKKLLGFFAEEVQEISNFEENKITQSNEKTEIKTDSNSKLHKLINE